MGEKPISNLSLDNNLSKRKYHNQRSAVGLQEASATQERKIVQESATQERENDPSDMTKNER
jgi:hypothetical protein